MPVVNMSAPRFFITDGGKRAIVGERTIRLVVNAKFRADRAAYPIAGTSPALAKKRVVWAKEKPWHAVQAQAAGERTVE